MPTLFFYVRVIAIAGMLALIAIVTLAMLVHPKEEVMSQPIPQDRILDATP